MFILIARIAIISLLISSSWLQAGIVWDKTEVEVTPKDGETKIEVPFPFHVEEGQPVQILETGSSCGCTVPALEKRIYAPGESGLLKVVFNSTGKLGRRTSRITLRVLEADRETRVTLSLTVFLPELVQPEVRRLEWSADETMAKFLKVGVGPRVKLELRPMPSLAAERFETVLLKDEAGGFYYLEARPVLGKPRGMTPVFVDVFQDERRVAALTIFLLAR